MRFWHLAGLIALQTTSSLICCQVYAAGPSKPIQECEQEFQSREAALRSAGVSAASFFHECWWHSSRGHLTELSKDGARDRAQRIQHDDDAAQLWTGKKAIAQASTSDHRLSKSFNDRREKRREARYQRRIDRIIAARAQRLVLAHRHENKRAFVADAREKARRSRIREERLAALSRRYAERRERDASSRAVRYRPADTQVSEVAVNIPVGAVDGRRSWIGTTTADGTKKLTAVLIGALQTAALKGTPLHCWDQNVLFLNEKARWQQSLVCDNKTVPNAQTIWFEQYVAER